MKETSLSLAVAPQDSAPFAPSSPLAPASRVTSIDALRGLIVILMVYVNDLAYVPHEIFPAWMRHHPGPSGMTFVDLIAPSFLFIVGMSIPFALGARLERGEPLWKLLLHIFSRAFMLILIGILMANGYPDDAMMGWSSTLWVALLYSAAILSVCSLSPPRRAGPGVRSALRITAAVLRLAGLATLIWLALEYRNDAYEPILTLSPFSIYPDWYQVLGMIGWAYLIGSLLYLVFRGRRTALLGCMVLLFCLFPADKKGMFHHAWITNYIEIGPILGTRPGIAVAGMILASILRDPLTATNRARIRFTLLFIAGVAGAAFLLEPLYGINWFGGTPSWCLSGCTFAATLWLILYLICQAPRPVNFLAAPLRVAGANILLAYLLSNLYWPVLDLLGRREWYDNLALPDLAHAVSRSAGCSVAVITLTALLNKAGFRLKL